MYENTIGWYEEWVDCNEIRPPKNLPWVKLPVEYKIRYILIHRDQIPAHLTAETNYNIPYSKSLVHLEYNPEPDSEILRRRNKYIKAQQRPATSLYLFEMGHNPNVDTRSQILADFEKFLDKEFPTLSRKIGCPKTKLPELTDLATFRMLQHYTPDETIAKIKKTYTQRKKTSLKHLVKVENTVHAHIRKFCQPYRPKLTPRVKPQSLSEKSI